MTADPAVLAEIAATLQREDDFLVTCHGGPDGDAIGSLLALGEMLSACGRRYVLYNPDGVPPSLRFLPGADQVTSELPDREFNWLVVLDCSGPDRVSEAFANQVRYRSAIVLDHHLTERPFGDLAYVDSSAAATGEIMVRLARVLDWAPTVHFATAAYTAIFTDTGSFQHTNTNARVLEQVAWLAELGADPAYVARQIMTQSPARVRMMRHLLDSMQMFAEGRIAVVAIRKVDMDGAGAEKDDLEGLVNIPRSISGVEIAAQLREIEPDVEYRVSLRSNPPADVERVAAHFGGGGHRHAAGCTLEGPYESCLTALVERLEAAVQHGSDASA